MPVMRSALQRRGGGNSGDGKQQKPGCRKFCTGFVGVTGRATPRNSMWSGNAPTSGRQAWAATTTFPFLRNRLKKKRDRPTKRAHSELEGDEIPKAEYYSITPGGSFTRIQAPLFAGDRVGCPCSQSSLLLTLLRKATQPNNPRLLVQSLDPGPDAHPLPLITSTCLVSRHIFGTSECVLNLLLQAASRSVIILPVCVCVWVPVCLLPRLLLSWNQLVPLRSRATRRLQALPNDASRLWTCKWLRRTR